VEVALEGSLNGHVAAGNPNSPGGEFLCNQLHWTSPPPVIDATGPAAVIHCRPQSSPYRLGIIL
jgi:hypothetical protein